MSDTFDGVFYITITGAIIGFLGLLIKQCLDNDGTIKIVYTPTDKLFVDLLTKSIQGNN